MRGGLSDIKYDNERVTELLQEIIEQVKTQTLLNCESLTIHSYKTQIVAGIIYYIKVNTSDNKYMHLKVMQYLAHENTSSELLNHILNKSIDDEIISF